MSVKAYAFVSARIGAMRSFLLESAGVKTLIEAPSWDDAVALLKDSEYGRELGKISNPKMQDIEEVLIRSLLRDYDKIISSTRGEVRKFIETIGRKFEVSAVKTIALSKILGLSREEIKEEVLIPFGKITELRISKMLETESPDELVESMRNTSYYTPLEKGLNLFKEEGTPFSLNALLDQHVYTEILAAVKNLKERDRKDAKTLLGTEMDVKNLLLALRCQGLEEEKVLKLFIRPWYKIKESVIRACLNGDIEVLTTKRFPYIKYMEPGLTAYKKTGSLRELELSLKKLIITVNRNMFQGDRFHIGVLIGYLNLKENEIRNLIAVLRGKKENLNTEDIRRLVILPGVDA